MNNIFAPTSENIARAAEVIKQGGLVSFPTETVYGLGADVYNPHAVAAIFAAKGRPTFNPLISHIAEPDFLNEYAVADSRAAFLAKKFWPGPLTIVLKAKPGRIPPVVLAGGETVGLRCPDSEKTLALLRACGIPLAVPSANPSGAPSPKALDEVLDYFDGKIDGVIDGGYVSRQRFPCRSLS